MTIPLLSNRMLLNGSGFIKSSLRIVSSCALQFSVDIRSGKEEGRRLSTKNQISIYGSSCRLGVMRFLLRSRGDAGSPVWEC
jgi:hypothetical protein